MEFPNTYLLIFLGIILILIFNYVMFYQTNRKLFEISGFLFFKYIFRIFAATIFLYLISSGIPIIDIDQNATKTKVYLIEKKDLETPDLILNFKDFILSDLKTTSLKNYDYSIGIYDKKKGNILKILPYQNSFQFKKLFENKTSKSFGFFYQPLDLSKTYLSKFEFENKGILYLNSKKVPLEQNAGKSNDLFTFNSLNFSFNLKLYLLFLLILLISADISISLKIIKI